MSWAASIQHIRKTLTISQRIIITCEDLANAGLGKRTVDIALAGICHRWHLSPQPCSTLQHPRFKVSNQQGPRRRISEGISSQNLNQLDAPSYVHQLSSDIAWPCVIASSHEIVHAPIYKVEMTYRKGCRIRRRLRSSAKDGVAGRTARSACSPNA